MIPILAGVYRVGDLLVRVDDTPAGIRVSRYAETGTGRARRGGLVVVTGDLRERVLAVLRGEQP